jgi:diguanylate cyclase (GGDEF)-like protein/PAS domain S-box-containing protein
MQRKDGSKFLVEGSVQLVRDADNRPIGFRGILRDVTSRREMEQALRESEQRFRSLIELSSDWYWEIDEHFRFARMETKRGRLETATHNHADLGKRPWESDIHAEGGWDAHRADLAAHRPFHDFVTYRRQPDGAWRYAAITGEPMFEASGDFKGYRGIGRDVTTEKIAEQRIQYLATHDGLTNLPNRVMFNELLGIAVQTAQRRASGLAVLFIDLDGFKVVNDSLGHEAGDRLLCETGNRLKQVLRGSDVVARFGGDEFVVLLQEISDVDPVATVARKILAAITQPVDLMGRLHRVTASVGISLYPSDAEEASTLLKHADAAMYVVKERGKNDFRFYPPEKSG